MVKDMIVRADLHIHTTISDGANSPKEVVLAAFYKGLNVIAITDHDTFQGALVARRYVDSLDLLVIIGCEVSATRGDILVFCDSPIDISRNIDELIDIAHANNCLVVPAHPFDEQRNSIGDEIYSYKWDAIEIYNASSTEYANKQARRAAKIMGLPGIGNSDAHSIDRIGIVYNKILVDGFSVDEVLESIKKNRVKIVRL